MPPIKSLSEVLVILGLVLFVAGLAFFVTGPDVCISSEVPYALNCIKAAWVLLILGIANRESRLNKIDICVLVFWLAAGAIIWQSLGQQRPTVLRIVGSDSVRPEEPSVKYDGSDVPKWYYDACLR